MAALVRLDGEGEGGRQEISGFCREAPKQWGQTASSQVCWPGQPCSPRLGIDLCLSWGPVAPSLSSACGEDGQDLQAGLIWKSCLLHRRSCLRVGVLEASFQRGVPWLSWALSNSINGGAVGRGLWLEVPGGPWCLSMWKSFLMKLLRESWALRKVGRECRSSLICLSLPRTRRLGEEGPVKDPRGQLSAPGSPTQSQKRRLSILTSSGRAASSRLLSPAWGQEMWVSGRDQGYHCKK